MAEIAEIAELYRKVGDVHGVAGLYNNAGYEAIKQGRYERASAYLDETLVLAERSGEPLRVMLAFGNFGLASLFTADFERAGAYFREQLLLSREHTVPWMAAEGVAGLAAIAARQGQPAHAARLLGAAGSLANVTGDTVGVKLEREFFASARDRLGQARWAAAYADGTRLGLDEAVRLALDG
jgi:hypothetical protein